MRPLVHFFGSILLGLLAAACGGEDKGRAENLVAPDAEPIDQCAASEAYEFQPIVDFEARGAECNLGIACSFYFNYDTALSPPDGCLPELEAQHNLVGFPSEAIPEGRCGESSRAFHVQARHIGICLGSNGRKGWGGAFDINFTNPQNPTSNRNYVASEWDGFSFWVRRGVPRAVGDNATNNRSIIVLAVDSAGSTGCDASTPGPMMPGNFAVPVPDTLKCDPFGAAVTLTDEWTFVPVRFRDMRQKGFGVPSEKGYLDYDGAGLVRLQFLMTAGDWDFWIDDVSFFRDLP